MSNVTATIGNTTADDFAEWLASYGYTGGATITPAIGFWNGIREDSVTVTFYNRTHHFLTVLLARYGEDHPDEESFGILDSSSSHLHKNGSHAPLTVPEEWT